MGSDGMSLKDWDEPLKKLKSTILLNFRRLPPGVLVQRE